MKPWRDLSDSEKLDRIAMQMFIHSERVNALCNHLKLDHIPSYEVLNLRPSIESMDDFLGVYGGQLTKQKQA